MKKQSKIAAIVLVIVVLVGGYYCYYKSSTNKGVQVSDKTTKDKSTNANSADKNNSNNTSKDKNGNGNSKANSSKNNSSGSSTGSSNSGSKSNTNSNQNNKNIVTLPDVTAINLGLSYALEINYDKVKEKVASVKFYNGDKEVISKAINLNEGKFTLDDEATRLEVLDKDGKVIAGANIKS